MTRPSDWRDANTDAAPSTTFLNYRKISKTKKEHQCYICLRIIPAGSVAREEKGMTSDDNAPYSRYTCENAPYCAMPPSTDDQ